MDRLPAGLTFSMLVAAISVGILTTFGGLGRADVKTPPPLVHTSAALCLAWSLAASLIATRRAERPSTQRTRDMLSVLQVAATVTALLAVLLILYVAVVETLRRTIFLQYQFGWQVVVWPGGLVDLAMVGAALLLHWRRTRNDQLLTALFWLSVLAALWMAFRVPAFTMARSPGGSEHAVPTAWAALFMLSSALVVLLFTIAEGWMQHRRRVRAWPDALSDLASPPISWPGFHYSAGVVGVTILFIACIHVVLPWASLASLMAGCSLLALTHRRWNENLADVALALITLAVASACMIGLPWPVWTTGGYASIFNRAVAALAVMTAFWHWLARVWLQQLDEGRAWTTAGRLVRVCRRVGFLTACAALLMSLHLTFWPDLPYVVDRDVSTSRLIWGPAANTLLILVLLSATLGTRKSTLAWLTLLAIASTGGFFLTRAPVSRAGQWWSLHWPLAAALFAAIALGLAWLVARLPRWRPFLEPLIFTGVLIAPVAAITGATLPEQLRMPLWVPPATFACLAVVYLIATVTPGPPTFAAVAVLCAAVAFWQAGPLAQSPLLSSGYVYGAVAGVAVALIALSYRGRIRPAVFRGLTVGGAAMAAVSLIAALVSAR